MEKQSEISELEVRVCFFSHAIRGKSTKEIEILYLS